MPAGTVVPSGSLISPGGPQGQPGPTTQLSTDAGNIAVWGSDSKIYVPSVRSYNSVGNSNFECDARTVGVGAAPATGTQAFAQDRWLLYNVGTNRGTAKQMAENVVLAGTSFCVSSKYLRYTLTTQEATLAASDTIQIFAYVEGPRMRPLLVNQTGIGILCRASVANTIFGIYLQDATGANSLTSLLTIPTAGVWTWLTIPNIPGWAGGATWSPAPGVIGYVLGITLAAGTTLTAAANGVWAAGNTPGAKGQGNFAANAVNSTFDIAYIGHEPLAKPSGVLDIDFDTNLERCKRYYQKSVSYSQVFPDTGGASYTAIGTVTPASVTVVRCYGMRFEVEMAKVPSVTMSSYNGVLNQVYAENGGAVGVTGVGILTTRSAGQLTLASTPALAANANILGQWAADTGW